MSASSDLYIKSVSHVATSSSVTEFFRQASLDEPSHFSGKRRTAADDIKRVDFLIYPSSKHRYCRVSFNTSSGVTSAMKLNGEMLNGVPTRMSVVDPTLEQIPSSNTATDAVRKPVKAASELQLVQQEREELQRTVCFRDIPATWTEIRVSAFVSDVLGIDSSLDLRVDRSVDGEYFALVLLQSPEAALRALELSEKALTVQVGDQTHLIKVERAQSVVRMKDPNIQFGVDLPSLPPVPIAYQSVKQLSINKKVEQARARIAQAMSRKLAGNTVEEYDDDQARREIACLEPEYLKAHSKRRWPPTEGDWYKRRRRHSPYSRGHCQDDRESGNSRNRHMAEPYPSRGRSPPPRRNSPDPSPGHRNWTDEQGGEQPSSNDRRDRSCEEGMPPPRGARGSRDSNHHHRRSRNRGGRDYWDEQPRNNRHPRDQEYWDRRRDPREGGDDWEEERSMGRDYVY